MPSQPLLTTRRAALGVVTVGVVAGCSGGGDDPTGTPSGPDASSPTAPAVDADTALVTAVTRQLSRAEATVAQALRAAPRLRAELGPFRELHRAHLAALGDAPAAGRPAQGAGDPRGLAITEEHRLQRALADAAVRAESGALARLLASMSAAVAQRLAVLR